MAKFCCENSIELEPKTLNEGQLNVVRELAVDIIQKKELQDSPNVLVQGLKADDVAMKEIVTVAQKTEEANESESEGENECTTTTFKCSCNSIFVESPEQIKLKEPFSAPF